MSYYYQFLNKVYAYYKKVGYKAGEEARIITFIVAGVILSLHITFITVLLLKIVLGEDLTNEFLRTSWIAQFTNGFFDSSNFLMLGYFLAIICFIGHLLYFKGKPFSNFLTLSFKDIFFIYLWGMGSFLLAAFGMWPKEL